MKIRQWKLGAVLIVMVALLVSLALAGCSSKTQSETKSGAAPQPEPPKALKLTVYAGMQEDHAALAIKEFEKETGVKTDFVRMSGGEILARIRAEKANPQASVWWGGPADTFIQATGEGVLQPYKSETTAKIADQYKDPNGFWTGIYVGSLGFASNEKFLQDKKVKAPESWADLLKPEFKGNVAMADPGSSGTAYTVLSTILQMKGEQEGFDYLKKLHKQIQQYTKSGSAPGQMAGLGEVGIGIVFSHDTIKYKKEGFPLQLSFPSEGTGYEVGAVGIIKGAPDLEAAQKFIDWSLGKKAQELGQTVGSFQLLTNPDAVNPPESIPLSKLKTIKYDFTWAGQNRQGILEKWNKEVKGGK